MRRLLALRRRVPGRLHPRRRGGEHPENRVSPGERYARIYEINLSRCIFCGYCELACPFDAITLGNEYEISEYSRDDLIYTKDMLLGQPVKRCRSPTASCTTRPTRLAVQGARSLECGEVIVWIVWVVAAFALLGSGFAVVLFSNPFYSALALIGNLGSLAVLYLLLSAEFVAAAQVLVYAGAVMVMFLFVIAYLGGRADTPWAGGPRCSRSAAWSPRSRSSSRSSSRSAADAGGRLSRLGGDHRGLRQPGRSGELFLSDHLLAFEITSIVLLVGAVGGVILGTPAPRAESRRGRPDRARRTSRSDEGPGRSAAYLVSAISCSRSARSACSLRRSPLIVLLALEIMLNAGNLALIAFARDHGDGDGQIFASPSWSSRPPRSSSASA